MKRILTFILSIIMIMAVCVISFGCNSYEQITEIVDLTKTQLYVANYEGGVGNEWLTNIKASFEAKYADKVFEENKKGVQIIIDYDKQYAATSLANNMVNSQYSVYFTEQFYYNDYISKNLLLDISDIITEPLSEITDGKETGSIEDKLTADQQSAFKALKNGYYALPHYEVCGGLTYDADLFESKNFYLALNEDEADQYGCIKNEYSILSFGPDGRTGIIENVDYSEDDGLPATYDEFFNMCDKMVANGITPLIWTGQYIDYVNMLAISLYANFEGYDNYMTKFTFDSNGESIPICSLNENDELVINNVVITNENAYLLEQQEGKYNALKFFAKILSNPGYYSTTGFSTAKSHLDTQEDYIKGITGKTTYAMIIEGNYWYNEAGDAFDRMVESKGEGKGYSAEERNFKWMALPNATETSAEDYEIVAVDRNYSYAFINANVKNDPILNELSKLFLQYCYTNEALIDFTKTSGCTKGVKYNLTETENTDLLNNLANTFYKSFWNFRQKANILYPVSSSKILVNNQSSFSVIYSDWSVTVNGLPFTNPMTAMKGSNVTALEYFRAAWSDSASWANSYATYFE